MADPRPKGRRRWRRWVVLALLVPVALVAGLPWLLGTPPARRFLIDQANRILAPGRLEVQSIRFSWVGPTRMTGFVIRDHQGDRVVASPSAVWDRSLWKILTDRPRFGTLRLDGAALDAERRPDGSIDLYEALKPLFTGNPKLDLTIRISRGSLRFRSQGLAEPLRADRLETNLQIPPAPAPIAWRLDLARGPASNPNPATLTVSGRFERWRPEADGSHDLTLILHARAWPVALEAHGLAVRGQFDGQVRNHLHLGRWTISGRGKALNAQAGGAALRGDRLQLGVLDGEWMLAQAETGWEIDRLRLFSDIGRLTTDGPLPASPGSISRIDGELDLRTLAQQLPHVFRLRDDLQIDRGKARLRITSQAGEHRDSWDVEVLVSDFAARRAGRPIALSQPLTLRAHLNQRPEGPLRLDRLTLETSFLTANASGELDRGINVNGTIDLDQFRRQAGDLFDLGDRELAGKGRFRATYQRVRKSFAGQVVADLDGLRVGALSRPEPTHLDVKADGPIASSGLPSGWSNVQIDLSSGGASGRVVANALPGGLDLLIRGAVPLANVEGAARLELAAAGRWDGRTCEIHEATADLKPGRGASESARPIRLQGRGRYDAKAGTLTLDPVPGRSSRAIAMSREGLKIQGLNSPKGDLRADLGLAGDLGALRDTLAAWTATDLPELSGSWSGRARVQGGDGLRFAGKIQAPDFAERIGPDLVIAGPLALDVRGSYRGELDRIDLDQVLLTAPLGSVEASGRIDALTGRRGADLSGAIRPDIEAINALLAERVEPGAHLDGSSGRFRLKGPLAAGSAEGGLGGLDLLATLNLDGADIYGLKVGPIPLTVRTRDGRLSIDPIRSTLNGGRLALDPEIERLEDGRVVLRLKPGSGIEGAEVNDEVSRRFLSYAAPVLDRSTRVRGRVSARLTRAEFPLGAGASRAATVEGDIVFQDVEFAPGPFAADLLGLIDRRDATLKLDQPIILSIFDGKVHQRGLAIPIGRLTRIEIAGTVDFDRNLDLTVGLPLPAAESGQSPLLAGLFPEARLAVPVRGTLDRPQIDREAFLADLKGLGERLGFGAGRAALGLLERLTRPRDPEAMPRLLDPAARKARRIERRAQRRRGEAP